MKILRIVPTMNPKAGGVAESIKQSSVLMKEENIIIEAVTFDKPREDFLEKLNFKVHTLGKAYSKYGVKFSLLSWLVKSVKNYDLVIIDGLWMFHVVSGYICKLKKIPYLIYSHGMLDPYFNKDKLKYLKKLPFWFLIERNVIRMAKSIVFTCKEEMTLAQKSFPLFKGNSIVATLGIEEINSFDGNAFLNKFPELRNHHLILFLSRIHEKKGINLLISAIEKIDKKLLENHIIVLAGSGDERYIQFLKNEIKSKNLESYFKWVGMLRDDMKWSAFKSSDAFILPSHQENFGIVVAEALSQKLLVLTTNKVNIWQEINEYNAGIIKNDDIDGIKSLLEEYINLNENEKYQMKENGYKCFNERFSKNAFKEDFLKLI